MFLHIGVVFQIVERGEGADFHKALLLFYVAQLGQFINCDHMRGRLMALV